MKTVLLVDDDESLRILVRKQDASLEHVLGEVQGLSSVSAADLAC